MSQGYDNQYRIASIVVGSILNLTYGYDPNGNINSILDAVNPPGGQALEFPGTYSYQSGTNKLTHIAGTPPIDYGYDSNGNITTENTWTYVYDLSNQPIRVLDGSNVIADYVYNGAGQRIKKILPTETRIFHYDLWGRLIAETNQTGQMLAEYVYLGDQVLTMIKPGESAYYFHNDHLGTPQVLTDGAGSLAWKAVYTPFGEATISVQTVDNPFRFPGQYYDSETGLHYNYFRYYNPPTGRYITPDPIGLEGGINLFAYVANDSINNIDPLGLANDPLGLAELREIIVLMLPDYVSVNINAGSLLGWSGQVALDRYGNLYVGLFGGTIGKSATVFSFSGAAGWLIDCEKRPSEDRLKDFLTKSSINYGFGYLAGLNVTKTPGVGKATEVGVFTPQVGASYHYSWFWKNTGWKW